MSARRRPLLICAAAFVGVLVGGAGLTAAPAHAASQDLPQFHAYSSTCGWKEVLEQFRFSCSELSPGVRVRLTYHRSWDIDTHTIWLTNTSSYVTDWQLPTDYSVEWGADPSGTGSDCTSWVKHEGDFWGTERVVAKCNTIAPRIKARGVLDIASSPDQHTPWLKADGKEYWSDGTVGWVRGSRVEYALN